MSDKVVDTLKRVVVDSSWKHVAGLENGQTLLQMRPGVRKHEGWVKNGCLSALFARSVCRQLWQLKADPGGLGNA